MKIAIIIRFLTRTGGATREVMELCRELEKRGHGVTIYTFAYDPVSCFPGEFRDVNIVQLNWDYKPWWSRFGNTPLLGTSVNRLIENRKAKRLARMIDPSTDVLNPHDKVSVHTSAFFKKNVKHIPSVWMMNDLDIQQWSIFEHPVLDPPRKHLYKRIINYLRDAYENWRFFSTQDAIGVIVASMGERAKKYLGRSDAVVVRSGADLDRFVFKERQGIASKKIRLYTQGIFYIYRRFEDIIRAVKILCDAGYDPSLEIVGDYGHKDTARAYYQTLTSLTKALGLEDRVSFRGVVSEEELDRAYYESDIFVFANIQTWGIAIFEAMATGLPVVLSRDAGAGEMLKDREHALLANTGDPEDIARAIKELADNRELYQSLSRKGNELVRRTISWSQYAENMERLFLSAAKRN